MILFIILATIAAILTVIAILMLIVGGTIGFIIFGDLIVCVFMIFMIIKFLHKKRKVRH